MDERLNPDAALVTADPMIRALARNISLRMAEATVAMMHADALKNPGTSMFLHLAGVICDEVAIKVAGVGVDPTPIHRYVITSSGEDLIGARAVMRTAATYQGLMQVTAPPPRFALPAPPPTDSTVSSGFKSAPSAATTTTESGPDRARRMMAEYVKGTADKPPELDARVADFMQRGGSDSTAGQAILRQWGTLSGLAAEFGCTADQIRRAGEKGKHQHHGGTDYGSYIIAVREAFGQDIKGGQL